MPVVNQGTLYPVRREQEGAIASECKQVETQHWEQTAAIIARFVQMKAEDWS